MEERDRKCLFTSVQHQQFARNYSNHGEKQDKVVLPVLPEAADKDSTNKPVKQRHEAEFFPFNEKEGKIIFNLF